MKPLRLKLKNFGTFIEADVDFARFDQTPFFLIHGNTGAGKTTLFDGICYALYEQGSSKYRDRNNLVSHHAKDGEKLEVEFWFERGHRTFHIKRQFGNSKSGKPGTPKQALTEVQLNGKGYEPAGQPLTKKTEVDEFIKNTLQFDLEQFRKIIILPQGQFAEFLHASTIEKSKILHELFGTEAYERLTEQLKKAYDERKEAVEELAKDVKRTQNDLSAALTKYLSQESPQDFEQALEAVSEQIRQKEAEYKKYSKEVDATQQQLNAQEQLAESFRQLEKLQERQRAHQAQEPTIRTKRDALEAARRAAVLRSDLERLRKLEKALEATGGKSWRTEVPEQCKTVPTEAQTQTQRDRKNELEKSKTVFEALEKAEKSLAEAQKEVQKAAREESKKQQELEVAKEQIKTLEKQIQENEARLEEKKQIEERIQKIKKWEEQREQFHHLSDEILRLEKLQKATLERVNKFSQDWQQKQKNYQQLFRQWREGQAQRLALDLREGEACPVCGSRKHPQKAVQSGQSVSDADLERAEKAESKAKNALDKLRQTLTSQETEAKTAQKQLEQLQAKFSEDDQKVMAMSAEEFERKAQKSREKDKVLQQLEQTQKKLRNQQLPEAQKAQETAQTAYDKAKEAHQAAKSAVEVAKNTLTERKRQLPEGFSDKKELQTEIQRLEKSITEGERLRKLEEQWKQFGEEEKGVQENVRKEHFPSIEAARKALLDESQQTKLDQAIKGWEKENVELDTENQRLQKATEGKQKPDLATTKQQLEQLKKQQSKCTEEKAHLLALHQTQSDKLKTLRQTEKQFQAKNKEIKPYKELYGIANGDNPRKQKFATYALSVFLDEVIRFANKRLKLLSDDEFQMERFDQQEGREQSVGLGIRVFNNNTGRYLKPKELSGGETFIHALALALGLADVVYAQSGGAKLDAMFIDEGFGTLDEEKQRKTLRALSENEGQYRMIGIISHVEQFKKMNIPKIHVLKDENGSRVVLS